MTSPFASIGPALFDRGFSPIPIRPDGKMPGAYAGGQWHIMRAWSKFCGEQPDAFSMKNWAKWPNANVGVCLGRGVVGFDIDREDMVAAILAVLPPVLVAKKGRKGLTAFYQADTDSIRSRGFKIDGFGVMDLIADGKQTVLPPSIHPDTHEPYIWTTERTLADTRPEELPVCTQAHFDAVLEVLTAHGWHEEKTYTVIPGERGDADSDKTEISEFYRKLNEDALANLAAWVPRLGLSRLHPTGDSYRSVAEWRPSNSGKPLHKRDAFLSINRKGIVDYGDGEKGYTPINLVMAAHEMADFQRDKAVVWLGDLLGYNWAPAMVLNRKPKPTGHVKPQRPAEGPAEIDYAGERLPVGHTRDAQPASPPTPPVDALDEDEPPPEPGEAWPAPLRFPGDEAARTPNVVSMGVTFAHEAAAGVVVEEVLPSAFASREAHMEALTHVPGAVGDLVDWVVSSARYPNRTLAFAGILAFVGTIAGRIYKSPTGLRTNIYTLGLAPTGFGKGHALECLDFMIPAATLDEWFGGDNIASGSAIRKRVEKKPAIGWLIDEFGGFLRRISNDKNAHAQEIRDYLLKYFEKAGGIFRGTDYAGEQGVPVLNPSVSLHGLTTQEDFFKAARSAEVNDGFFPRFLVFSVGAKLPERVARPETRKGFVPENLVTQCREIAARLDTPGNLVGRTADGTTAVNPCEVRWGAGAEALFDESEERYRRLAFAKKGTVEAPFLNRLVEHAQKIAMILAIGVDPHRPVISADLFQRGLAIAEHSVSTIIMEMSGRLADNDRQREHIDVKRWIIESGPTGITLKLLSERINGRFDDRRLGDILKSLVETSREIGTILYQNPKGGRKTNRYVAAQYLDQPEAV